VVAIFLSNAAFYAVSERARTRAYT
jgi:hypothetical protein